MDELWTERFIIVEGKPLVQKDWVEMLVVKGDDELHFKIRCREGTYWAQAFVGTDAIGPARMLEGDRYVLNLDGDEAANRRRLAKRKDYLDRRGGQLHGR